jgi:hypothetical protein
MILASMASTISFNSRLKPNRNGNDLRIQEMKKLGYATFSFSEGGRGKMTFYKKGGKTIMILLFQNLAMKKY